MKHLYYVAQIKFIVSKQNPPKTPRVTTRGRKPGEWAGEFRKSLKAHHRARGVSQPIPPLRELAEHYGVNHTTIFRQLQRAEEEGLLWKAPNGRHYLPAARSLIEKARPVACLFRKIENWSFLYQELMEGIAARCETAAVGSLLWHDDALVRHPDLRRPPSFAGVPHQIQSLKRFVTQNENMVGGIILDHLWTDEALATLPPAWRKNAVRLCRPGVGEIASVAPDFPVVAHLALTHVFALGYRAIQPIEPFPGDSAIAHSLASFLAAAEKAGAGAFLHPVMSAADSGARARLIRRLQKTSRRTALIFPEDNTAAIFREECRASGIPQKIGVISLQGTRGAGEAGLTHVRTNYRSLGETAVEIALNLPARRSPAAPFLVEGSSTAATTSARLRE